MSKSFFRGTDHEIYTGTLNFSTLISALPANYGLTPANATSYATVSASYRGAYETCITPETRTKSAVAAKNTARAALREMAEVLAKIIYAHPGITDEQLIDLGLALPKHRTPIPPPTEIPELDIVSVNGRTVKLRAHDPVLGRGKPAGVTAITVFTFVGPTPPEDTAGWTLQGTTGRTRITVTFPAGEATTVWFTAFWQNARGYGPACEPKQANLAATVGVPSTQAMSIAA